MNVHGPKHGERNSEERQKKKEKAKGLDRTTGISVLGEFDLVVEELSSQVILRQVSGTAAGSSTDGSSPSEMFSE